MSRAHYRQSLRKAGNFRTNMAYKFNHRRQVKAHGEWALTPEPTDGLGTKFVLVGKNVGRKKPLTYCRQSRRTFRVPTAVPPEAFAGPRHKRPEKFR